MGPAADVYSPGATLHHLLAGRVLPAGQPADAVLRRTLAGDVPSPRAVRPGVPAAPDAVCRKAMAPLSAERYATASALADDVDRWLADEPVSAGPDPWPTRLRRFAARHRTLAPSRTIPIPHPSIGWNLRSPRTSSLGDGGAAIL